jgi:hypothetical protein
VFFICKNDIILASIYQLIFTEMEILGKLLGSVNRVKIMRLFLLNKDVTFDIKEIEKRSLVKSQMIRKELKVLESVSFVRKRSSGYQFNSNFKYQKEFESLLISSDSLSTDNIHQMFKKAGKIRLLLVAGVFIKNEDSRLDLFIVGDNLKRNRVEDGVKKLEAEIGREITYAIFEYQEFIYRLNMYDKLIRDVLDFPHKVIFQAKELSTQALKKG